MRGQVTDTKRESRLNKTKKVTNLHWEVVRSAVRGKSKSHQPISTDIELYPGSMYHRARSIYRRYRLLHGSVRSAPPGGGGYRKKVHRRRVPPRPPLWPLTPLSFDSSRTQIDGIVRFLRWTRTSRRGGRRRDSQATPRLRRRSADAGSWGTEPPRRWCFPLTERHPRVVQDLECSVLRTGWWTLP